jgi:hypothetical protein
VGVWLGFLVVLDSLGVGDGDGRVDRMIGSGFLDLVGDGVSVGVSDGTGSVVGLFTCCTPSGDDCAMT